MSPTVLILRSVELTSAVFTGSLKYSNGEAGLEPELAGLPGRNFAQSVVQHVNLAERGFADSARMREPFRAVANRHAHRFGRAVVLEDDRPPPVDHRLLDPHGTGRCGVDCDLERGEIISEAHGLWQFQHAREHGRHKLGVSDAILLDEFEEALLDESLHDDDRAAAPERAADPGQRRRVVERRRRKVNLAFAKPPDIQPRGERRQRLSGRLIGQRTQHTLGSSGRARGIEHRRSQ
jgi:hypothetical protein